MINIIGEVHGKIGELPRFVFALYLTNAIHFDKKDLGSYELTLKRHPNVILSPDLSERRIH